MIGGAAEGVPAYRRVGDDLAARIRSGVFVARPRIEQSLDTVAGLSDQLGGRGVVPGAEVLHARTVSAGDLGDGAPMCRCSGLRGRRGMRSGVRSSSPGICTGATV
jgi:DNA-binding GntR family transcriptional regulator